MAAITSPSSNLSTAQVPKLFVMRNFFCLISKADVPVYEAHLSPQAGRVQGKEDLMQFILHASLDSVDAKLWQTPGMSHL